MRNLSMVFDQALHGAPCSKLLSSAMLRLSMPQSLSDRIPQNRSQLYCQRLGTFFRMHHQSSAIPKQTL